VTARDRLVVLVIAAAVILGAAWLGVVSPARKHASEAAAAVESGRAELVAAQQQAASVRDLVPKYKLAKRSDAVLRGAVPAQPAVPQLVDEIQRASEKKDVQFASITSSGAKPGAGAGAAGAAAAKKENEVDGMQEVPFSFIFAGGFFEFERLVARLTALTRSTRHGTLAVAGRLLVFDGVHLAPEATSKEIGKNPKLTGTVTVTAFEQSPTSSGTSSSTTPASGTAPTASATAGGSNP